MKIVVPVLMLLYLFGAKAQTPDVLNCQYLNSFNQGKTNSPPVNTDQGPVWSSPFGNLIQTSPASYSSSFSSLYSVPPKRMLMSTARRLLVLDIALQIPYCETYTDELTCEKCYSGYTPNSDLTHCDTVLTRRSDFVIPQKMPKAITFLASSGEMLTCPWRSYPSDGKCLNSGANCLTYDSCGRCLSCPATMVLSNGLCDQNDLRLTLCKESNGRKCTNCSSVAIMNNN